MRLDSLHPKLGFCLGSRPGAFWLDSSRAACRSSSRPRSGPQERGAVLLEVILALVLFVAAATIISAGLNASLNSVERLRLSTHAANLATSVLSELQMGIKTTALSGPQPFQAPFEEWTWEVLAGSGESEFAEPASTKKVEVIVRHGEPPMVYRLTQMLQLAESKSTGASLPSQNGRYLSLHKP